jgi:hypothetical protein
VLRGKNLLDYRKYVRHWGADIGIKEFVRQYWLREQGAKVRIPKAMDHAFLEPASDEERTIKTFIDKYNAEQATKLEQELFKQRKRLANAERTLQTKTKVATESKRRSMKTSAAIAWRDVNSHRARRTRTSSSSSSRSRGERCSQRLYGHVGPKRVRKISFRSQRLPTSHPRKWPRLATTAASSRSDLRMRTHGSHLRETIDPCCRRCWMIASGLITNTGWRPSRR